MLEMSLGLLLGLLAGAGGTLGLLHLSGRNALSRARQEAGREREALLKDAENRAREIELSARQEALKVRETLEADLRAAEADQKAARRDLEEREARLDRREDSLDRKSSMLDHKEQGLAEFETTLETRQRELADQQHELAEQREETKRQLRQISGMNEDQARAAYLKQVEDDCRLEAGEIIRRTVEAAQDEAREKGRTIILEAIQRYSAEACAEHTVSSIIIPDEAMKGRVIGREGRNIRSFEKATGVDVVIDDTPASSPSPVSTPFGARLPASRWNA
jgi:ribonuclease Y